MDDMFKAKLTANLDEVLAKLGDLLNTSGSVTDICEVDAEILDAALNLKTMIIGYQQYLAQPEVKPVRYYPRPRIGYAPRRPLPVRGYVEDE